ncbi:uncharacterized protein LOC134439110 [Engraulis encrasicolus]|uniref:uncharacterized protein LOC134439110 n=1 Tax=Engraulis encrasicolus TaxID=184585 RepID=UPI002FD2D0B7
MEKDSGMAIPTMLHSSTRILVGKGGSILPSPEEEAHVRATEKPAPAGIDEPLTTEEEPHCASIIAQEEGDESEDFSLKCTNNFYLTVSNIGRPVVKGCAGQRGDLSESQDEECAWIPTRCQKRRKRQRKKMELSRDNRWTERWREVGGGGRVRTIRLREEDRRRRRIPPPEQCDRAVSSSSSSDEGLSATSTGQHRWRSSDQWRRPSSGTTQPFQPHQLVLPQGFAVGQHKAPLYESPSLDSLGTVLSSSPEDTRTRPGGSGDSSQDGHVGLQHVDDSQRHSPSCQHSGQRLLRHTPTLSGASDPRPRNSSSRGGHVQDVGSMCLHSSNTPQAQQCSSSCQRSGRCHHAPCLLNSSHDCNHSVHHSTDSFTLTSSDSQRNLYLSESSLHSSCVSGPHIATSSESRGNNSSNSNTATLSSLDSGGDSDSGGHYFPQNAKVLRKNCECVHEHALLQTSSSFKDETLSSLSSSCYTISRSFSGAEEEGEEVGMPILYCLGGKDGQTNGYNTKISSSSYSSSTPRSSSSSSTHQLSASFSSHTATQAQTFESLCSKHQARYAHALDGRRKHHSPPGVSTDSYTSSLVINSSSSSADTMKGSFDLGSSESSSYVCVDGKKACVPVDVGSSYYSSGSWCSSTTSETSSVLFHSDSSWSSCNTIQRSFESLCGTSNNSGSAYVCVNGGENESHSPHSRTETTTGESDSTLSVNRSLDSSYLSNSEGAVVCTCPRQVSTESFSLEVFPNLYCSETGSRPNLYCSETGSRPNLYCSETDSRPNLYCSETGSRPNLYCSGTDSRLASSAVTSVTASEISACDSCCGCEGELGSGKVSVSNDDESFDRRSVSGGSSSTLGFISNVKNASLSVGNASLSESPCLGLSDSTSPSSPGSGPVRDGLDGANNRTLDRSTEPDSPSHVVRDLVREGVNSTVTRTLNRETGGVDTVSRTLDREMCDLDSGPSHLVASRLKWVLQDLRGVVTQSDRRLVSPYFRELVKEAGDDGERDKRETVNEGFLFHPQKLLQPRDLEYREGHQYAILHHIQNGSYGDVFSAVDLNTGFKCAAKKVPLCSFSWEEVGTWSGLSSPRVLQLFGAVREGPNVMLFMDLKTGSLAQLLRCRATLPEDLALHYHVQVLEALEHLHRRRVLHMDIKVDNVLLSEDGLNCFLCDFGLSEMLDANGQTPKAFRGYGLRGTESHMAPEVARGDARGAKADVWSSCCMLLHMLTGCHPWTRYYAHPLCLTIVSEEPPLREAPASCHPLTLQVLHQGLTKDPQQRASASQLKDRSREALHAVGGLTSDVSTQSAINRQHIDLTSDGTRGLASGEPLPERLPATPASTQKAPPLCSCDIPQEAHCDITQQEAHCDITLSAWDDNRPQPLEHWVSSWRERAHEEDDDDDAEWESDDEDGWSDTGQEEGESEKEEEEKEEQGGSDLESLREKGSDWMEEEEEWEPFHRLQILYGPRCQNKDIQQRHGVVMEREESGQDSRSHNKGLGLDSLPLPACSTPGPRHQPAALISIHDLEQQPDSSEKESGDWSDDLSSGVFSIDNRESFNVDWLVSTNQPPSCCIEGLGVDIWIEDFSGESFRIREKPQVKLGLVAMGISEQISERTFCLATLDGKLACPDEEVQESGTWLQCVPAEDDCPTWTWRIRDGNLEERR